MLRRGRSSTVFIQPRRGIVRRFGWGRCVDEVRRNYEFLQRFSARAPLPHPLGKREIARCVWTTESLLPGAALQASELDVASLSAQLAQALAEVYRETVSYPSGGHQSWIHGDLTFRNMLFDGERISVFDCGRSIVTWPEFDLLTLTYDWRTHMSSQPSYQTFMRLLLDDRHSPDQFLAMTRPLYGRLPMLAANATYWREILTAFGERNLTFFVQDCRARGISVAWADEIATALRV